MNATVLNSPPILENVRIKQPTVDPNAFFQVIMTAGDNNTLRDIKNITVDMSSASGSAMCQFVWDASGYHRLFGEGILSTATSRAPADWKVSAGEWRMDIKLPGHLASGRWELTATVYDEEATLKADHTVLGQLLRFHFDQPAVLP